jgi:anti-sigma factor ChrR (cupin superfamily)
MENYEWASVDDAPVRELFPGIRLRPLWSGAVAKAFVLQMEPGSRWQGVDVHDPGPEEVFVVDGVFNDGNRDYPAGSFIHAPAGSSHVPQSAKGCTLFLFYPEG